MDFDAKADRGHADALTHLGAETCATVTRIAEVVAASRDTWTWHDIKERLPDGVRQKLAMPELYNAAGGLGRTLAKRYHWRIVGYAKSPDPDARGRRIALYANP
jgi:hypothetical protein